MRVVLDVNVWISGLLWGGIPGQILYLARTKKITILASVALFLELETTLLREKFQPRLQKRGYTVEELMSVAKGFSELYPNINVDVAELRDPKDNKILAAAKVAKAEVIITGDFDNLHSNLEQRAQYQDSGKAVSNKLECYMNCAIEIGILAFRQQKKGKRRKIQGNAV